MPDRFSWHIDPTSRLALNDLAGDLQGGQVFALAGAGVSVRVGLATWADLVDQLGDAAKEYQANAVPQEFKDLAAETDLPWKAEEFRRKLTDTRYQSFFLEKFKEFRITEPVEASLARLVSLPVRHVLTTNYDTALEQADRLVRNEDIADVDWSNEDETTEFIASMSVPNRKRHYVHLHGRWDRPASIVFSERDYIKMYVASNDASQRLHTVFSTQKMLIVGYSLQDIEIAQVFRQLARARKPQPRHYVILQAESESQANRDRKRLEGKYGIRPIFYVRTHDHRYLEALLDELSDLVNQNGSARKRVSLKARTAAPAARPGPYFPDDPQKGQWGGQAIANGRELYADVERLAKDQFRIHLQVRPATAGDPPVSGLVRFHLHDTFATPVAEVTADADGIARYNLVAYGAFTVGAEADEGKTRLELDLAEGPYPPDFRQA